MFRIIWSRWKAFSHKVATFQARLILTIFYFIALAPVGLLHTFVRDTLNLRGRRVEGWQNHYNNHLTIEKLQEQY
jgi:hypothetical protein